MQRAIWAASRYGKQGCSLGHAQPARLTEGRLRVHLLAASGVPGVRARGEQMGIEDSFAESCEVEVVSKPVIPALREAEAGESEVKIIHGYRGQDQPRLQ